MLISVLIPTLNEKDNLILLIPKLHQVLQGLVPPDEYEIVLIDGGSTDGTIDLNQQYKIQIIQQQLPGYGGAIKEGLRYAKGDWLFTMDADLSHDPQFLSEMWQNRKQAEVIIASRYIPGGKAVMPVTRIILSRILNFIFSHGLSLNIRDMSSGFRLYQKTAVEKMELLSRDFDVLEEILINAYAAGWRIREIPFHYFPRYTGRTHAKLIRFGFSFLRTFYRMWVLRNSIQSADYDARAYDSIIPLQRYWQRTRVRIINNFEHEYGIKQGYKLDIGCGSSKIIRQIPELIGVDIQVNKLRYLRYQSEQSLPLANATIFKLPFRECQFDTVICSQVIEHIAENSQWFDELTRVLKPDGILILGTPDYSKLSWRFFEYFYRIFAPSGYADEHITHYTLKSLSALLAQEHFQILDKRYICNSELIIVARKETQQ